MATIKKPAAKPDYRTMRRKLDLSQSEFWGKIGVTQSGGSRYESGRAAPTPTKTLVSMAYGSDKEAFAAFAKLRGVTVEQLRERIAK